ncbi:MAG: nitroreductase [Alphaproteobacteria bacterium]|nr:nitroreductase [Alphaproteobacteria bacterium]
MAVLNDTTDTLSLLKTRRSTVAKEMVPPGPSAEQTQELLEIAARVPDHGKLAPWRFILFEGEGRSRFGAALAARFRELHPETGEDLVAFEAGRFERAPLVIGVVSKVTANIKIPEWEQQLSAGAVCQNLLIAATAMGFAAQWLTEWYAFDDQIAQVLGLDADERMAGFVYVASRDGELSERARPDLSTRISHWPAERA